MPPICLAICALLLPICRGPSCSSIFCYLVHVHLLVKLLCCWWTKRWVANLSLFNMLSGLIWTMVVGMLRCSRNLLCLHLQIGLTITKLGDLFPSFNTFLIVGFPIQVIHQSNKVTPITKQIRGRAVRPTYLQVAVKWQHYYPQVPNLATLRHTNLDFDNCQVEPHQ